MFLLSSTMSRSFIREDLAILGGIGEARFLCGSGPFAVPRFFYHASRSSLAVSWFASVYSLPLVLGASSVGAPSIIIIGGADAAAMPEIGYGLWLNRRKGRIVQSALRRASLVLAVDQRLLDSLRDLSGVPLENALVVPTGYDQDFWSPGPEEEKGLVGSRDVLCVASCDSHVRGLVKGIDLYLEAAARLPDLRFTLVGADAVALRSSRFVLPSNVEAIGELPREDLRLYYRSTRLYCQPSRHEGLPNALCEALLCGTPAVATDVGGTHSALGNNGILVPTGDVNTLVEGIREGLRLPEEEGRRGRKHVAATFPLERRREELTRIVSELLSP
jgi:glycosyltransferase involved in cell wall biosynthesis